MVLRSGRRHFLKSLGIVFAGSALGCAGASQRDLSFLKYGAKRQFKMKFTPRLGMGFKSTIGSDMLKRLEFFRDAGFRAVEGVANVSHPGQYSESQKDYQRLLGKRAKELGLEVGNVSSMNEKHAALMCEFEIPGKGRKVFSKQGAYEVLDERLEKTFGVLERIGSKTFIIGAGVRGERLPFSRQFDNVVECMAYCAGRCRERGYVMEIEPLCDKAHPGIFIDNATFAGRICALVDNPSCRILFDTFHEHVQTGSLDSLDDEQVWTHIESFHIADSPDRFEPTTGLIDFPTVLKKIWDRGFRGFLGLEHLQSARTRERDMQILQIYRELDSLV